MTNQQNSQVELTSQNNIPFEQALTEGFKKLTNEVFLFLLCYMIIMAGLELTAKGIIEKIRPLLYIMPIGGVAAYVWLEQSKIPRRAKIKAKVEDIGDEAEVRGEIGKSAGKNIDLSAKKVSGKAKVIGSQIGYSDEINYLISRFENLNDDQRSAVIDSINALLRDNKQLETKSDR